MSNRNAKKGRTRVLSPAGGIMTQNVGCHQFLIKCVKKANLDTQYLTSI